MTEIDSSKAGNIMFMLNSPQKIFIIENRPKSGSSNNIPQNRIKISNPKQPKSGKIVICRVENDCIISVHKPVHAFNACAKICIEAEKFLNYTGQCEKIKKHLGSGITVTENTCFSAVTTVLSINAKAIVCLTESGRTAQIISRFIPPCVIVALTNSEMTCRQMRIIRGVYPFHVKEERESDLLEKIFEIVKNNKFAQEGDFIVIVGGISHNFEAGATCSMKILTAK